MSNTPVEAAEAAKPSAQLPTVKTRRRPWMWAVAALLITVGALGTGAVVTMVQDTTSVLATSKAIARGAVITESDLVVVQAAREPGLVTVPADKKADIVGKVALADVPSGQLINLASVGEKLPLAKGSSLVGVSVSAAQRPANGVEVGTVVILVATPKQGDPKSFDAAEFSTEGTVVSVSVPKDNAGGNSVIDVAVPADVASKVAGLSAEGRIAVIVKEA